MKILLILPRLKLENAVPQYNYTFPLGIGYISAVMKKAGYDVTCLNLNHEDGDIKNILKVELAQQNYDVVATGHIWHGYNVAKEIINSVRMFSNKSKIILGGALVTSEPELVMNELKVDYGIIGEGEVTILELLECIEQKNDPQLVDGIIYFDDENKLITTNKRELITDLDSLPYPDFDSFDYDKYLDEMYPNQIYINNLNDYPRAYVILASRGCPFQCTFCYHSLGRYRERSVKNVLEEIRWAVKKYKINVLTVNDDTFGINKKWLNEFCDGMKKLNDETPWNINWSCQMVVSSVTEDSLRRLKEAGCFVISYGFESYSAEVLKSMKKPATPEQIDYALKKTWEAGIAVQGNFLFGDPAETEKTAQQTFNYWTEECQGQIQLTFVQPYAGSKIYEQCLKKGLITDKVDYMSRACVQKEVWFNMTDKMTNNEVTWMKNTALNLRASGHCRVAIPKFIGPWSKENRWIITVECPFCQKNSTYRNYYFNQRTFYKDYMCCRKCHMRFYVLRPQPY